MSYRRYKKKKNSSFIAISVIVCSLLVYALIMSSGGKWIGENVIKPMFKEEEQVEEKKQHSLSLNGYTAYAMQIGAFNSEDNAKKEAESVMKRGGAGYILNDGSYRVMAFAYKNEADANNVKSQLKSVSNIDAGIYTISIPKIDFKITSDEKNFETINNGFNVYNEVQEKVHEVALKYDKKEITKQQAENEMNELLKKLKENYEKIEKIQSKDEKIQNFKNMYKEVIDLFNNLKESDETVFSGKIKNIYIEMVCKYSNYVKSLTK